MSIARYDFSPLTVFVDGVLIGIAAAMFVDMDVFRRFERRKQALRLRAAEDGR